MGRLNPAPWRGPVRQLRISFTRFPGPGIRGGISAAAGRQKYPKLVKIAIEMLQKRTTAVFPEPCSKE